MTAATSVNLSAQIRTRLSELGIPQAEIARRMKIDSSIPQLWASGKRDVPAARIDALAEALQWTRDDLLADVPEPVAVLPPDEARTTEGQRLAAWLREQAAREARERQEREAAHLAAEAERGRRTIPSHALWPMLGPSPVPGRRAA